MMGDIVFLHRGYVRPIPHERKARAMGDPATIFELQPVDLSDWLNRPKRSPLLDDLRDFAADIREHSDIAVLFLTLGICAGALATMAFALVWSM